MALFMGKKLTQNLLKTLKIKQTIPTYICFYFLNKNQVWTFFIDAVARQGGHRRSFAVTESRP